MRVFEQRRAARTLLQAVLIVGDRNALLRRQRRDIAFGGLVRLAARGLAAR
jgi:hypothetical protein